MQLKELEQYDPITIQCHDNPDGDALASGYGLYCYFKDQGKDVHLVYSGQNRISKKNLTLMVEKLNIPVEHLPPPAKPRKGLLITVDCQYGAGNVTRIEADVVAVVDHHQIENRDILLKRIDSALGSCSTLVWQLLQEVGYDLQDNIDLGTALYYGLYTDTNQFEEIYHPSDRDMRDSLVYKKSLITMFRNSNISLKELEIAGIALIRYIFNDDYNYVIIHSQPCDPNILGLISDFLIQVDEVQTCVVYNEIHEGFKLSVRSCIKEVKASELAAFLCGVIGSGGGHLEKAGGFISKALYEEHYPTLHSEAYLSQKMNEYFDECDIIYAGTFQEDPSGLPCYRQKSLPMGYVRLAEVLPVGTAVTVRTREGDTDMTVQAESYVIIDVKGQVSPMDEEAFRQRYEILDGEYRLQDYTIGAEYMPIVKNRTTGDSKALASHAGLCRPKRAVRIHARQLNKRVKVFASADDETYMLGCPGDYLAVQGETAQTAELYIVEEDVFSKIYEPA